MPRGKPVNKTVRKPQPKPQPKIEKAIEQEENDMSKITKETPKWGEFTVEGNGVTFVGEDLVEMEIPYEDQNPVNHHIMCINGNQIILGVDKTLKIPQSVHDNWKHSVKETTSAKKRMKHTAEIKV